jgi:hypothetical protein
MRQVISSGWTMVLKLLLPFFSVALSLFLLLRLLYYPTKSHLDGFVVTLLAVAATVFFCWLGIRLKQVAIDENKLYVAGFFKEIAIPLTTIESVRDFHGGSPVIVRLKEKSDFGRTILFAAKWQLVFPWEQHSILTELNQLIRPMQDK